MYIVVCYIVYLAVSLAATVGVARTLHKNGRTFLIDAFQGDTVLADSVNHLLVVGLCLINVGYVATSLPLSASSSRLAVELLGDRIGVVLILLGVMQFLSLFILARLRRGRAELPTPITAAS